MPFCPICKGDHDPDVPCFGRGYSQALRDAGIPEKRRRMSRKKFRQTVRRANRSLMGLLLIIVGLFCMVKLLGVLMDALF